MPPCLHTAGVPGRLAAWVRGREAWQAGKLGSQLDPVCVSCESAGMPGTPNPEVRSETLKLILSLVAQDIEKKVGAQEKAVLESVAEVRALSSRLMEQY